MTALDFRNPGSEQPTTIRRRRIARPGDVECRECGRLLCTARARAGFAIAVNEGPHGVSVVVIKCGNCNAYNDVATVTVAAVSVIGQVAA
jgi:hypothetical protein